ncbi:phosphoribosylanthranilate isomerase [Noviherbaspirillum saxi]|uniref:N-(5'-phosphoribosyl)anthranilate isomerase n=2 Tax=Noviherbaspirillum saxi TaxID=2320863 RepID=A0A3A3FV47_9BURK|nr:phosphoribosylanthranilate isomerase [Noviherbaspirillum saxi]
MTHRTRVKICGITRSEDLQAAIAAGADAIGLVFYDKSPRFVSAETAASLLPAIPPFVTSVGLFVNATSEEVMAIVGTAPVSMLQFHGDETIDQCCHAAKAVNRPFMRAIRMKPGMTGADLLEYEHSYRAASRLFSGILLDAFVDGYGGGGKVFDWSLIPKELAPRVVLSGGLSVQNATEAVLQVRPHAVDVSSGVELSKGIKDPVKISEFIRAVRAAEHG